LTAVEALPAASAHVSSPPRRRSQPEAARVCSADAHDPECFVMVQKGVIDAVRREL